MTPSFFDVRTVSRYERLSNKLHKGHRDFEAVERNAAVILASDPHNRTRQHHIKKLEGIAIGEANIGYRSGVGDSATILWTAWYYLLIADCGAKTHIDPSVS